ncbi:MAG: hypothetical protein KF746_02990 [Chitinophagaceae bacterium]|nr:hypothetical protein [Chitinophagaceae bacterium]
MKKLERSHTIPPYKNKELADIPGEEWKDIPGLEGYGMVSNYGRIKRLQFEIMNALGRVIVYEERIQAQKMQRGFNEFKKDYKILLQARIQVDKVCHSISVGRVVYCCFVEKFDLQDRSVYITYKDGNGLNTTPGNLIKTDLTGLQQLIMKAGRKDLHFGHSVENQKIFTEKGRQVNIKAVGKYNMEGCLICTYESLSAAAIATNISITAISSATRQKGTLTAGGFIWRVGKTRQQIAVTRIHKAIRAAKGAAVSQYDVNGKKLHTYFNITQAAKAVGKERKTISQAISGRILTAGGFIWRKGEAESINVDKEKKSLLLRKGYMLSQYDLTGKKIATFHSSKDAARSIGVQTEQVNAMAIRDDLLLKGHIWRYGDAPELPREEILRIKRNVSREKVREVTQYDLKGKKKNFFHSMTEAARSTGVSLGAITSTVNGHKATGGGFIWRRGNGKAVLVLPATPRPLGHKLIKEVLQFDLNGKMIQHFPSIKEAARTTGVHFTTISAVLRGDVHTAGGFVWKRG